MAKRSTKKPAGEKPRAFLLGTMTLTLISETLAEVERLEVRQKDAQATPGGKAQPGITLSPEGQTGSSGRTRIHQHPRERKHETL